MKALAKCFKVQINDPQNPLNLAINQSRLPTFIRNGVSVKTPVLGKCSTNSLNKIIMSKLLSIVLSAAFLSFSYSQDKIYVKGQESPIEAKVIEITQTEIKYKKFNNQEGPIYTSSKNNIAIIKFENGVTETFESKLELQKSPNLAPTSRLYLEHSYEEDKRNTDGDGALAIAKKELQNLTKCKLVNSVDDADFTIDIQVVKGTLGNRKAKFTINHLLTGKTVYESKWVKGAPSEFNGFSGTRRAIGKIIKKDILITYPEISKK